MIHMSAVVGSNLRTGQTFFFPISFSLFFCIFAFKYYIFIIADILKMIL